MISRHNIFAGLLFTAIHVSGLPKDTTGLLYNASEITYISEVDLLRGEYHFQTIDTSVLNLSCYNPVHKQPFDYKFLGKFSGKSQTFKLIMYTFMSKLKDVSELKQTEGSGMKFFTLIEAEKLKLGGPWDLKAIKELKKILL